MPKKKVCRNQRSWAWPSVIPLCLERSKFKQENFNVGARGLLYSTFSSIYNSEVQYEDMVWVVFNLHQTTELSEEF